MSERGPQEPWKEDEKTKVSQAQREQIASDLSALVAHPAWAVYVQLIKNRATLEWGRLLYAPDVKADRIKGRLDMLAFVINLPKQMRQHARLSAASLGTEPPDLTKP